MCHRIKIIGFVIKHRKSFATSYVLSISFNSSLVYRLITRFTYKIAAPQNESSHIETHIDLNRKYAHIFVICTLTATIDCQLSEYVSKEKERSDAFAAVQSSLSVSMLCNVI